MQAYNYLLLAKSNEDLVHEFSGSSWRADHHLMSLFPQASGIKVNEESNGRTGIKERVKIMHYRKDEEGDLPSCC